MKFTSTGVAAAAMIAFSAFGVTALHSGVLGGPLHSAAKPPALPATFQMYANVDQDGDLGSNVGAVSAKDVGFLDTRYLVTFSRPIGSCAAQAEPGFAGGNLVSGNYTSQVRAAGPDAFIVVFVNPGQQGDGTLSAFMLTVTCRR